MSDESLAIDFEEPVPLFPLPSCVLLPHATIPLHIFEPRYRRMVGDALEGNKLIAMAVFRGEDWKQDYEGNPPIRPFVCLGYVVKAEKTAGGRYNILLQGVCRARVVREVPHEPYRTALLEPLEAEPAMEIDLTERRDRLNELLGDRLLKQLSSVSTIQKWLSPELPTPALIDLSIMALCDDSDQRYEMLAQADINARASWIEDNLRRTRRTLAIAERFGVAEDKDGANLN